MPQKVNRVALDAEIQKKLRKLVKSKKTNITVTRRCQILLALDNNSGLKIPTYAQLAERLAVSISTITNTLSRFRNGGIEAIIKCKHSKASSDCHIKADARIEAHVVALACGPVPKGYARWTLVLLKRELVLVYDDQELSTETIRRLLKRNKLQPHKNSYWCIPQCHLDNLRESQGNIRERGDY